MDGALCFENVFIFSKLRLIFVLNTYSNLVLLLLLFDLLLSLTCTLSFLALLALRILKRGELFVCSLLLPLCCAISRKPEDGAWEGESCERLRELL